MLIAMKITILLICLIFGDDCNASKCGCKQLRDCYEDMLNSLQSRDEASCIEDAAIGSSTMVIFFKALEQFCGDIIQFHNESRTYEGRILHEININMEEGNKTEKPIIVLEAGQQAGSQSVEFALFMIEQLVACEEYSEMIENVRWVILPCTNPDGQEYSRFSRFQWRKNVRNLPDGSLGVDISRNFDKEWASCDAVTRGFSTVYPGPSPASENETQFVQNVISKYKSAIVAYVSIRRDGHGLSYPYANSKVALRDLDNMINISQIIANKVNQRAGGVQMFKSNSIYEANGKSHCGHSVDYVYAAGVPTAFEMRVFLGSDIDILSRFQTLPRGFEATLRNGYFLGIRELYNIVMNDKKMKYKLRN